MDVASGTYTGYQRDDNPPSPTDGYYVDPAYTESMSTGGVATGGVPTVAGPGKLENIARKTVNRLSNNSERDHFTLNVSGG